MIGMPHGAEWLVIFAIVVLVFGAAKLPDLARGTGQALRIFKAETKGLKDDDADDDRTPTTTAATPAEPELESRSSATADRQPDLEADAQHVAKAAPSDADEPVAQGSSIPPEGNSLHR